MSQKFLHWLDEGTDSHGQRYAEVRRRLELYFDRKNCVGAAELADETLNRVARKLEERSEITDVAPLRYCYNIAQYVFLEALRDAKRAPFYPLPSTTLSRPSDLSRQPMTPLAADAASEHRGRVADCLQSCLENLSNMERELIAEYYRGPQRSQVERRAALASRLGVTANTLSIGASRIRRRLEASVQACQKKYDT